MSLLSRKRKRECFPVETNDGTLHVRPMKISESERLAKLEKELQTWFMLGCCLVTPEGSQEIAANSGETDAEYAARAKEALDAIDFDLPTLKLVSKKIELVTRAEPEDLKKSLPTTQKPDLPGDSGSGSGGGTGGT